METRFEPHKSLLDLDANIVVLIAYLGGIIVSFIPGISIFSWAVAIIIFFVEKDSKFVRFHAMQAILLTVTGIIMTIIIGILIGIFFGVALLGSGTAGLSGIALAGFLTLFVKVALIVLMIIAVIKGWSYECYEIPVIGKLATKIVFK